MSDTSLQLAIKEENSIIFKRSVRKLLDGTFVLRERDERFYNFLARESNRQDVSAYLRLIGFDILLDTKSGVAMLVASEDDADTVGLKRANVVTFTTLQYHLLLVLWKTYLEGVGYNEGVFVSKGDLIDKIKSYGINLVKSDLNTALRLFRKYSLINYSDADEGKEDMEIRLYPSLQFGWDLPQFKTAVDEYLREDEQEIADEMAVVVQEDEEE